MAAVRAADLISRTKQEYRMLSTSDRKSEGDTTGFKYTLNTRLFCYPFAALVSFVMEFILTLKGSQALKVSLF